MGYARTLFKESSTHEFYVHKSTFRQGYRALLSRSLGSKQVRMIYAQAGCLTGA
jgi:hypothetical protein